MFACLHVPGLPRCTGRAALYECASAFSPLVEETAPDAVVLAIGGTENLFGSPRELAAALARRAAALGLDARVAIASNPDAAVHAARGRAGITVIGPGQEAGALAPLPVAVLSPPPEIADTFVLWGIRTCGDLARLGEAGVAERLGPEGVRLRKLARGAGDRPLAPADPPPLFEETIELEYPVALLEPLLFILARLLNQLCTRLEARGLAANELRVRLKLTDQSEHERAHRLPFPMRDSRTFLKLLQLDLDAHPPPAPVTAVLLSAGAASPRVVQNGMFVPLAPEPEKLELTLARIAHVVGEGNVGAPELTDTHRPDAFRVKRFSHFSAARGQPRRERARLLTLRLFRPPLRAEVEAPAGQPALVRAGAVWGRVTARAGPWRTAGDWWRPDAFSRDEWDVALTDGALYRLYLDRLAGEWYVEGSYD